MWTKLVLFGILLGWKLTPVQENDTFEERAARRRKFDPLNHAGESCTSCSPCRFDHRVRG